MDRDSLLIMRCVSQEDNRGKLSNAKQPILHDLTNETLLILRLGRKLAK